MIDKFFMPSAGRVFIIPMECTACRTFDEKSVPIGSLVCENKNLQDYMNNEDGKMFYLCDKHYNNMIINMGLKK